MIQNEENKLRPEQSYERTLNTRLNQIRKKRLEQEYKHELLDKIQEKQKRQESCKINAVERSNNSYATGIHMRD